MTPFNKPALLAPHHQVLVPTTVTGIEQPILRGQRQGGSGVVFVKKRSSQNTLEIDILACTKLTGSSTYAKDVEVSETFFILDTSDSDPRP